MALIDDARVALRLSATSYDSEITNLIEAAKMHLLVAGVSAAAVTADTVDDYIQRAVVLYCKAQFGLDNPDSEKYMRSFEQLCVHLAVSAEYQQPAVDGLAGTIAALSDELTLDDVTAVAADAWLSIAGAGAGGGLLVAQVTAVVGSVATLDRLASTAVTDAEVRVL